MAVLAFHPDVAVAELGPANPIGFVGHPVDARFTQACALSGPLTPVDIAKSIRIAGLRCIVGGVHAISAWCGDPRGDHRIELIVADPVRCARALLNAHRLLRSPKPLKVARAERVQLESRSNVQTIDLIGFEGHPILQQAADRAHFVRTTVPIVPMLSLEGTLLWTWWKSRDRDRSSDDRKECQAGFRTLTPLVGPDQTAKLDRVLATLPPPQADAFRSDLHG
ncbi:MAG: hypothetical protein QM770_05690 [Tepidisphaeraceae bacterium]